MADFDVEYNAFVGIFQKLIYNGFPNILYCESLCINL